MASASLSKRVMLIVGPKISSCAKPAGDSRYILLREITCVTYASKA
jgi:hypothetical protein